MRKMVHVDAGKLSTKHRWVVASLTIVAVLVVSSICASIEQQQSSRSTNQSQQHSLLFGAITPLISTANSAKQWSLAFGAGNSDSANLSTRAMIMQYVILNPGVYLRELSEYLQLPIGLVQYHIWFLVKNGQVIDYRNGRYRRFFGAGVYGEMEQKVLSLMRQHTAGKILALLAANAHSQLSHTKLAEILGITSQALTWHMGRLRTMGIVESSFIHQNGGKTYHLIADAQKFVQQHFSAQ